MKKLIFIIACLFLIGCQTNDEPIDEQDPQTEDEENQVEETEQDRQDDEGEDTIADEGDTEEADSNGQDDSSEETELEPGVEADPEEEENETEQNDSGEDTTEPDRYSSDEAIVLVQEYVQGTDSDIGFNYNFDGEDDQGNYRIQVFEVVDHGEGESHTATYGWYLVNPDTGEITDLFD